MVVLVAVCLGGTAVVVVWRHQIARERERIAAEIVAKATAEKEKKAAEEAQQLKEKLKEQERKMALAQAQRERAEAPLTGPAAARQTGLISPRPLPGEPIPPIIPAGERFVLEGLLTATSIDSSPFAVINKQQYHIGDRILVGPDLVLTISSIDDGFVVFTGGYYKFRMRVTPTVPK